MRSAPQRSPAPQRGLHADTHAPRRHVKPGLQSGSQDAAAGGGGGLSADGGTGGGAAVRAATVAPGIGAFPINTGGAFALAASPDGTGAGASPVHENRRARTM